MSVEDGGVVDFIGIDKESGDVILTVSDHLDWKDTVQHQTILQEKLNKYLAFVESGEIFERYPDAKCRSVRFRVVFKNRPDFAGQQFLARARKVIEAAGFRLQHEVFAESYDN